MMHLKSSPKFCQFADQGSMEEELSSYCLVLTNFIGKSVDLEGIKSQIIQQFPFVQKVEIHEPFIIKCYFQSISDLVEIGQGRQFGATKAYMEENCYQQKEVIQLGQLIEHDSDPQLQVSSEVQQKGYKSNCLLSLKKIPQFQEQDDEDHYEFARMYSETLDLPRPLAKPERLTSLEDEVESMEQMRRHLCLFQQQNQQQLYFLSPRLIMASERQQRKNSITKRKQSISTQNNSTACFQEKEKQKERQRERSQQQQQTIVDNSDDEYEYDVKECLGTKQTLKLAFQGVAFTLGIIGIFKFTKAYLA